MAEYLPNGHGGGCCMSTGGGADSRIVDYAHCCKLWEVLGDGFIQLEFALIVKCHQGYRYDRLSHGLDKVEFVPFHAGSSFLVSEAVGMVIY